MWYSIRLGIKGLLVWDSLGELLVSLSKAFYPQLTTGSTKEDMKTSQHDCKVID